MENLLVFDSTHQAMQMEEAVKERKLEKARLIPTPESITASCGLSLKFQEKDTNSVTEMTTQLAFKKVQLYRIEKEGLQKTYRAL